MKKFKNWLLKEFDGRKVEWFDLWRIAMFFSMLNFIVYSLIMIVMIVTTNGKCVFCEHKDVFAGIWVVLVLCVFILLLIAFLTHDVLFTEAFTIRLRKQRKEVWRNTAFGREFEKLDNSMNISEIKDEKKNYLKKRLGLDDDDSIIIN